MKQTTKIDDFWPRYNICDHLMTEQANINALGEAQYYGDKKHRYYRAAYYVQQAIWMLQSLNESHESKVIEVSE